MRLSEKTIELNFCAQLARSASSLILWFGLTQKQEASAGFDACTKLGGRLLIFQFKASNHVLASGRRRFHLPHDQLVTLKAQVKGHQRSVFYVFPMLGNTLELAKNPNVPSQCWLLDVAKLGVVPAPTKNDRTLRKSGIHYADAKPNVVTVHSDPIDAELLPARSYAEQGFPGADGFNWGFRSFAPFWEFSRQLSRNSAAAVIAAPGKTLES